MVVLFLTFYLIWSAYCMVVNLVRAKRIGLPILIRYIAPTNPLWIVAGNSVITICRWMPFGIGYFTRFYATGWASNDRHKVHVDLGDAFVLVSPGEILKQMKTFRRDVRMVQMLSVYEENVFTFSGQEWQKHRKATMVAFAHIGQSVWEESLLQTDKMLQEWLDFEGPVKTVAEHTKVLTINVLSETLFSGSCIEGDSTGSDGKDTSRPHRDSLRSILFNLIHILIIGSSKLESWWMPTNMKRTSRAVGAFRQFVLHLIEEEKAKKSTSKKTQQRLVSALVRACEEHNQEGHHLRRFVISENEIVSNMFVYAVAGMDTTPITLATAIVFLSAYSEYQDWIAQEISFHTPHGSLSPLSFETFPKLKRCMAVMLETLRLCHPVSQLIKTTGETAEVITLGSRQILIPPNTPIQINLSAMQTHPQFWGSDSLSWNPQRWIVSRSSLEGDLSMETLLPDTFGQYIPWAVDQHVRPGKKYFQVELVAVLAKKIGDYRVEPYMNSGETIEAARSRALGIAMETQSKALLNEMRNPDKLGLVWSKREVSTRY
ncbi:cytochrome P450 monooxygenase-like protein [Bimuria novae-zelandiae CBS 107.79]|uniref:Cytochrome P450 monooxygenase-like protein n=1 Tax=Bimuria novae-zelandiae CBS 107.79 TaxID=1447943 RepID=A0A6A5VIC3_9PLEO|nr:cytochrome P450 monooxygenase-like protein [Bimuria novae-zelandiae CBS 107.79]